MSARGGTWIAAASIACLLAATTLLFDGLLARRAAGEWRGEAFELRRDPDSAHYFVGGAVNGIAVRFLVDTGASTTSVPAAAAVDMRLADCRPIELRTANGVARGCATRADAVDVGPFRLVDTPVVVAERLDEALLGMSFLQHFDIAQRDGRLILSPKRDAPVGVAEGPVEPQRGVRWLPFALLLAAGVALAARWFRRHAS